VQHATWAKLRIHLDFGCGPSCFVPLL
jgi:hypothetical protein